MNLHISRRGFIKAAGITAACAAMNLPLTTTAAAEESDFVKKRQESVYKADAEVYKIRKSQDNPLVKNLYDPQNGFLHDGPCGHMSHRLLHTHYVDRSDRIRSLKARGFKLKL